MSDTTHPFAQGDLFSRALVDAYVANPRFLRRDWLAQEVEERMADEACRFVLLTAEPGFGKSMFMAQLAVDHPDWLRYFIRRDQRESLSDAGARSFLMRIGFQMAERSPDLFPQDNIVLDVVQEIDVVQEDGLAVGVDIKKLVTSPFYRSVVVKVRQNAKQTRGSVVGISIGTIISDPRLLPLNDLQHLALFDPASKSAQPLVILVDALDELRYHDRQDNILQWLTGCPTGDLPSNVRFVLTSRSPASDVRLFMDKQQSALRTIDLTSQGGEPAASLRDHAAEDVVTYVDALVDDARIKTYLENRPDGVAGFEQQAVQKADGNIGYLDALARGIDQYLISKDDKALAALFTLESLPDDMQGLYAFFLHQIIAIVGETNVLIESPDTGAKVPVLMWSAVYAPLLAVLAVAREPVTLEQIQYLAGITASRTDLNAAKDSLLQFLDSVDGRYLLYHATVAEFLTAESTRKGRKTEDLYVDPLVMNLKIVGSYVNQYAEQKQWDGCDGYGLRYLTDHLIDVFRHPQKLDQANRRSDANSVLRRLLAGDRFLLAKARRFGLWAATEDLSKLKGTASGRWFDAGVTISAEGFVIRVLLDYVRRPQAEGFVIRVLLDCVRRPQAWTRTTDRQTVEALIREAEDAGEGELLPMLSDIKNGMRVYRRAEIVHAPPQAVFDVFAERESIASWIQPWGVRLRPKPVQAHALQVGDEICGWRVVAAETGRMVQLQDIADQGMWQHIAITRETDTISRILLVRVLPLNRWLAFSDLGPAIFPVILAYLASLSKFWLPPARFMFAMFKMGSDFLSIIDEWDRDVLRRIARLVEARNQVDLKWQKALCRDYTGGSLLVGAGIVLSFALMFLSLIPLLAPSVFTNVLAGPLALLALAVFVGAFALNLMWLRQARRIEQELGVTLPGAKTLQVLWRRARVATILMCVGVIVFMLLWLGTVMG